jgi:lysophospholipase L1-like esterase
MVEQHTNPRHPSAVGYLIFSQRYQKFLAQRQSQGALTFAIVSGASRAGNQWRNLLERQHGSLKQHGCPCTRLGFPNLAGSLQRRATVAILAAAAITCSCCARSGAGDVIVRNGDTVAFLGDSITAGGGTYGGFCRLVIQGLKTRGIRATPVLAGVPGDTSATMLLRLDSAVLDHKPDWVVLAAGVNDIWHSDPTVKIGVFQAGPGMGVALEHYKGYVTRIVDRCEAAGTNVILTTITPIKEDPKFKLNRTAARYNAFLHALAQKRKLPIARLNEEMFAGIAEAKAAGKPIRLTSDGVHPIQAGHCMMAKGILRAMGLTDEDIARAETDWHDSPTMLVLGDRQTAAGGRTGGWRHLLLDGMNADRRMVTCRGVSKPTVRQLLEALRAEVGKQKPGYVLLQAPKGDAEAPTPPAEYRSTVATLIDFAAEADAKPTVATIAVQGNRVDGEINGKIKAYNDILREVAQAKRCPVADIHAAMLKWYGANPGKKLTFDGERFNHAGGALMAQTVLTTWGYGRDAIASLRSLWDARPSYTFLGTHRATLSINLSKRGREVLEEVGDRYHKIGPGQVFGLGLHMLLTADGEQSRRRIAAFDREWTTAGPGTDERPYQVAVRRGFSQNQVRAIEAFAAKEGIDIREVFTRAFKVGVHAMRNDDVLGRGRF